MMTCRDVQNGLRLWEAGAAGGAELAPLVGHLETCPACASRYRTLLPLLRRDAGTAPTAVPPEFLPELDRAASDRFETGRAGAMEERIMARITARKTVPSGSRRAVPRYAARLAAAAAVLLAVIGFSRFVLPSLDRRDEVLVRFTLSAPDAAAVMLAGDFTDWDERALRLEDENRDGVWEASVRLRKGRTYTYNFVIDGETWIPDPGSALRVQDGFGGESSLLKL